MRREHRLAGQQLFEDCRWLQLRRLARAFDDMTIAAGEVVVRRGRADHWLYVIDQGYADVLRGGRVVGRLGPGEWFGGAVRPVYEQERDTIRAATTMAVFVLNRQRLPPLLDAVPTLKLRLPAPSARPRRPRPSGPARCRPMPVRVALPHSALEVSGAVTTHDVGSDRTADRVAGLAAPLLGDVARRFQAAAPPSAAVPPGRELSRPARRAMVAGAAAVVSALALVYHPPVAVVSAGRPVDVTSDIVITGLPVHHPTGRYVLTSVHVDRPTLFGLARSVISGDGRFEWAHEVDGSAREAARQAFEDSRRRAVAAAVRAAGLDAGERLRLGVQFRPRRLAGPSAGLIYALALTDMLGPGDLARGRVIAATGTIDLAGRVGEVGGLAWKSTAATRARAAVFFVPRLQAGEARDFAGRIREVRDLQDALGVLEAA